jgi:hypothetical protein
MFNSIINAFKATSHENQVSAQARNALADRMDHMIRVENLAARIYKLEVKTPVVVKEPRSILLKKNSLLRRSFAA